MVAAYYEHSGIAIYHADCRDVLPALEAETVNLVCTDPPYGVSGNQDEEAILVDGHAPFVRRFGEWDLEWDPRFLLQESARLLVLGGSLVAFMADQGVAAFEACEPLVRKKLGIWLKTNPAPRVRPGYQNANELWACFTKPGRAPTWNGGFTQSNAIVTPNAASCEGKLLHPTQKPLRLIAGFVHRHSNPGDLVLDPFMGSGTTLRAAKDLRCRAIGI